MLNHKRIVQQVAGVLVATALLVAMTLIPVLPVAAQESPTASPILAQRVAVVRGQGGLLLNESGRSQLSAGALVILVARNADGTLFYVESEGSARGWVAATALLAINTGDLPIQPADTESDSGDLLGGNAASSKNPSFLADNSAVTNRAAQPSSASSTLERSNRFQVYTFPSEEGVGSTAAPEIYARITLSDSRLNLRTGPSTAYPVIASVEPGSFLDVVGRTTAGDWVQIIARSTNEFAWGSAQYMEFSSNLDDVPTITQIPPVPVTAPATPALALPAASGSSAAPAPATASTTAAAPTATGTNRTGLSGILVFNDRIGGTIYGYDLETDRLWSITGGIDPAISPDSRRVAFTRDGGERGLYMINIDGSGEQLLYGGQELLRSPKFSPDGQYIVFSRSNGYVDCRLISGGACLPDDAILDGLPPELQGPGAVNAVRGLRNQREYFTVLSRIGVDGTEYRDIPSLDKAGAPDWGKDGIVYHSSGAGIQWTGDNNGQSSLVVDDELHGYFHDPDWHPTVRRIAFHRKLGGGHWQIHLVNSDGSGLTAITRPVTALVDELPSSAAPAWSPDGEHIIYVSNRNSIESAGAWHFWVMDADGSNQRRLPIDVPIYYTFSSEQFVSWGPSAR